MDWVFGLKERRQHRTHTFIVFAEDGLKYSEIELTHFKHHFIENF